MKTYEYYNDYTNSYCKVTFEDLQKDAELMADVLRINASVNWNGKLDFEDRNMRLAEKVCDYYNDEVGIFNARLSALIQMAVDMVYPYEDM